MTRSFSRLPVTPSYDRIRQRFRTFMIGDESADVGHLVLALLCEESLGGKCLTDLGVTIAGIAEGCFGARAADTATLVMEDNGAAIPRVLPFRDSHDGDHRIDDAEWFQRVHERAGFIARRSDSAAELSSEHLLQAMVEVSGPARTQLEEAGLPAAAVLQELLGDQEQPDGLAVDFDLALDDPAEQESEPLATRTDMVPEAASAALPGPETDFHGRQAGRVLAVIDANLNRSREGLRVLEDYARFIAQSEPVTRLIKHLRHDTVAAEQLLPQRQLREGRNTESDAGTTVTTASESRRNSVSDVVTANSRRVQEALRSLEEFGKIVSPEFAGRIKQLRYQTYELEQKLLAVTTPSDSPAFPPVRATETVAESVRHEQTRHDRLRRARLYCLISESTCRRPWRCVVEQALAGGVDVIQLREKHLSDEELVRRGQWIRAACESAGALFILNDRADLAQRAKADGVHLGQEDTSVSDARKMLQPDQLVGVSTHTPEQIVSAIRDGADYLGVGPVFPSKTKIFDDTAGLDFVRRAAEAADRPWFAIGGIDRSSIHEVLSAGATGIAVCSAIGGHDEPQQAAADLCRILNCSRIQSTVRFSDDVSSS